jgi:hypothetical protein
MQKIRRPCSRAESQKRAPGERHSQLPVIE